ncbi:diguanylate cyclase [Ketobacter sp. MCCC 1A13808]|uniref:sensor domain-containing diguanylate cyclase n=1 Tax=Ketobacter sp. MCCC 1A13808 TaxID=2602738 RepID=UPI0012EC023C|nr:7TM diverse intracellular signaling domain-containing protein [Ketobacter sp. MCCC 1A13808]MVF14569.1 diguanylate cyclase [Ketobacter sp. MCCC 1A13808]
MGIHYGVVMTLLLCIGCAAIAMDSGSIEQGTIVLKDVQQDYSLGESLRWKVDAGGGIQIAELLHEPSLGWVSGDSDIPNLGYSSDPVWFRTSLENASPEKLWYLLIDYPLIRDLDVYYVRRGEVSRIINVGDRFEFSARPVLNRGFIFPVRLARGETLDLYFRMNGPYAVQMPLHIMTSDVLLTRETYALLPHGLFFGFVLVMACYNFFLFLATHEKAYLFYTLFTLSIGLFQFIQQGFAFQFLWPKEVWWQNKCTGVFIHLSLICSYFFISSFLDLRRLLPILYRVSGVLMVTSVITVLLVPWLDEFWVMRFGVILALPATLLAISSGWLVWWRKGRADARYFSLAWSIFLIGVLLLAMNKLGILPRNFITEHGAEIGTVIELALLAFALASRITIERNQRLELQKRTQHLERAALQAKERALDLERMNSEQLEQSVRERTRDLHKAMSELAVMNRRLEQMNMTDSITGVGNENSLLSTLRKEWDRCYRSGELLSLIVVELDEYREIIADHGKVASDECLKNVADILERIISRPADLITRYGDKVFGVVLPATDAVGAGYLASEVLAAVIRHPFDFGVAKIQASVSIGVACALPRQPELYKDLLMAAEGAVYVAQTSGGNRVQITKPNS